jgi:hypothetical protein
MVTFKYIRVPCQNAQDLEERCVVVGDHDDAEGSEVAAFFGKATSIRLSLLIRPTADRGPGLYAYSACQGTPNIRATRLAMACGLLSLRFQGDVLLFRHFGTSLSLSNVYGAACVSPDLRPCIQQELGSNTPIPRWLIQAAQQNYHDAAVLREFAQVMTETSPKKQNRAERITLGADCDCDEDGGNRDAIDDANDDTTPQFIAKSPLCLECRRSSNVLCPDCQGCYFCQPPQTCRTKCWSHDCVCATWKVYTGRKSTLNQFPFDEWHLQLLTHESECSEEPYRVFLEQHLGRSQNESSWWRTETDGWAGGQSASARLVDPSIRRSYEDGFAPVVQIPPQERPSGYDTAGLALTEIGFLKISTWKEYYQLRQIPLSSPVALLLTFPLTLYHAVATFGHVPVTVARMLKRPLRLHLVGVEKELNFLDLFREFGYLLPLDLEVRDRVGKSSLL